MSHDSSSLSRSVVGLAIGLLALGGLVAQAFPEWGISKPVPAIDAFWAAKPKPEPNTVFLWQFDEKGAGEEEALAALEDTGADTKAPTGPELVAAQETVACKLAGDAAPIAQGRFGGALHLGGKGAATATLNLPDLLDSAGACTFDLWIRPAANAGAATLLDLAARDGSSAVSLTRAADGVIAWSAGEHVLLAHTRRAPAGTWTHVAGVIRADRSAALLVNGSYTETTVPHPPRLGAVLATLGRQLSVGAGLDLTHGFTGDIDAVRLSRRERLFYAWADESVCDPAKARPLVAGPPFLARKQPLPVSCSFDGTLTPEEFGGLRAEGQAGPESFQPGVRGQALDLSKIGAAKFALVGHTALPLAKGTIEFWFRPINWNNFFHGDYLGKDQPWLTLLQFAQAKCEPWRGLRVLRIAQGRTHKDYAGRSPWMPIHPGKWTHVVCTWSEAGTRVYLDGEPQPIDQVALMGPLHPLDTQEHDKWLKESGDKDDGTYRLAFLPSGTLVDEFRAYSYAFAPEEARNAYVRFFPDAPQRLTELPAIRAEYAYDFYARHLTLRLACMPVDGIDPATVSVKLLGLDGKPVLTAENLKLDNALKGKVEADAELGFGSFPVEVESRAADGRVLKLVKTAYVRERPPWWQNTLGKAPATVPKPWTPVQAAGSDGLKVWGRALTLAGSGLPSALTSAGADLLAGPVTLTGRVGGAEAAFTAGTLEAKTTDERATWTGTLQAKGVRARVAGELEYDGLMTFTVTLAPDAGATASVEELHVDLPLKAAHASQLIANGGGFNFRASWDVRMLPAGTGKVWDSLTSKPKMDRGVAVGSFLPMIWLGDDARGLSFFGENDAGWTPGPEQPAQEIRRDGDTVVLRLNIVTRPARIEKERTFRFCLQATPTKPLPAGWRAYGTYAPDSPVPNVEVIDQFVGRPLYSPADRPSADISFIIEPDSWEAAAANAAWLRDKFGKQNPVLFYMDYSWPKMGPSMADYSHSLWAGTGRMAWTREVEDYFVYSINEYLKRGDLDGIYIDDMSFGRTLGLYATAYRLEDGKVQPGFNSLGFRRFLQRLWVLFDQAGKTPHIVPHMTWCFEIPALSFADVAVNGEDRDILFPNEARYMQVWSREELRVMGGAEKWGFLTFWKSGLNAEQAPPGSDTASWTYWQGRGMHAHLFQHRLSPMWANYTHATFTPALARFGMTDPALRFLPDWDLGGAAQVTGPGKENAMVCLLAKPDRALMMVSNYTGEDRAVTVAVDAKPLFGAVGAVAFADADIALVAPVAKAASKAEIKAVKSAAGKDLVGETDTPTAEATVDELEGKDPAAKEAARLALKADGNTLTVMVRRYDFRLILVTPAKGK